MTAERQQSAKRVGRRRALTIIAAAGALPLLPWSAAPTRAAFAPYRWRGRALGAEVDLAFAHPDESAVRDALSRCLAEIERLEQVFSLFRPGSELCRLNRDGRLAAASHDLRAVLAEAGHVHELTVGAFDVTVQPLWRAYANWAARGRTPRDGPESEALAGARELVDGRGVSIDGPDVTLARAGMAVTLNGIAQGYITDRVADLLRAAGFERVLIQLGEAYALGRAEPGRPWTLGIPAPEGEGLLARLEITDRALATSSGAALAFDPEGRHHHLLDPRTGQSPQRYRSVSVVAPRAATADALSTALSLLPAERTPALLAATGAERAFLVTVNGRHLWADRTALMPAD
jgi:thiamine biosynthesis lipoprotein